MRAILSGIAVVLLLGIVGNAYVEHLYSIPEVSKVDYSNNIMLTPENTVNITGYIEPAQIVKLYRALQDQSSLGDPLYFIIDSEGGDLETSFKMITLLKTVKRVKIGICINCHSAAFTLLQQMDYRYVTEASQLMQHYPSGSRYIKMGTVSRSQGEINFDDAVAKRHLELSKISNKAKDHVILEQRMLGSEAVELGLADKVITFRCDSDLYNSYYIKIYEEDYIDIFLIKTKCPSVNVVAVRAIMFRLPDSRLVPAESIEDITTRYFFMKHAETVKNNALNQHFNSLKDYHE